jgi:hypothetical protein
MDHRGDPRESLTQDRLVAQVAHVETDSVGHRRPVPFGQVV